MVLVLNLNSSNRVIIVCVVIFVLVTSPVSVDCQSRTDGSFKKSYREREILNQIFSKNGTYNTNIRATGGSSTQGETQVLVNIMLNSISKVDDYNMEYRVQLTLREEWIDDRLTFSHLDPSNSINYITISDVSRIWTPDIFFINEKDGHFHNIIKPNVYIRIYPNGQVQISFRLSLTLSCPMNLQLFPMDTQKCAIIMASYAWTTEDLVFQWKDTAPIQLPNLTLPRFTLRESLTSVCDRETITGNYSCLRADFVVTRNFSFYLTQMYIPCIMLVIVSWVSFWLDENAVPARCALGITTLLTMATQQANMNTNLPPVSYIKALDIWSGTCLVFIFGALLEYTLVNYASRFDKRHKTKRYHSGDCTGELRRPKRCGGCLSRTYTTSKKIDVTARIVFPLLFLSFNIVYWVVFKVVLA